MGDTEPVAGRRLHDQVMRDLRSVLGDEAWGKLHSFTIERGWRFVSVTALKDLDAMTRSKGGSDGGLMDIHVPVSDFAEAKRAATLMRKLGATIEDDLDIRARLHLIVCHYGARRVIVEMCGTTATRAKVMALVRELSDG